MKAKRVSLLVGVVSLFCCLCSQAQQSAMSQAPSAPGSATVVPNLVRFSGVLKDDMGRPLTGVVGVTFALYENQEGGAALWIETQNVKADANGNYSALLGSTRSTGVPTELFAGGQARWLGVQPEKQPEMPRVLLTSVPYAMKASDAQTLGGLPASAFLQAQGTGTGAAVLMSAGTSAAATSTAVPITSSVTTGGLASGTVPVADGPSDLKNSEIKDNGTTVTVGSCSPASGFKQDVCGAEDVRGLLEMPTTGTATATKGFNSQPTEFTGSSFSSLLATPVAQHFRLQTEPTGNNTSTPSGTFNLLYATGTATPSETGISFSKSGKVTATTFSGNGAGLSAVNATTLGGFAASAFPRLAVVNTFTANQSITGNLGVSGTVTAGAFSGSGAGVTNVNAASLGGFPASDYAFAAFSNTFVADQFFAGNSLNTIVGDPGCGAGFAAIGFGSLFGCTHYAILGSSSGDTFINRLLGRTLFFRENNSDEMTIAPGGKVGIANTSPATHLDIGSGSISIDSALDGLWFKTTNFGSLGNHEMLIADDSRATTDESIAIFHCNTTPADDAIAQCGGGGDFIEAFRFQFDGSAFAAIAWNAGGVDVAEKYPNAAPGLAPGDVVVLDTSAKEMRLAASDAPYQENLLGVVSEKPGVVLGGSGDKLEEAKGISLALTGRVPVKVTLENGPIRAGDYLTSSSRAGYAMRATKSGRVIGIALTSFGSDSDPATTAGKLTVFVNTHHWVSPDEAREMRAEIRSLKAQLESREEEYRQIRAEVEALKNSVGISRASLVAPAPQVLDSALASQLPSEASQNK